MKKILAACVLLVAGLQQASALTNGDLLTITQGEQGCLAGGVFPNCNGGATGVVSGSYFAMDYTNNGIFDDMEKTPIGPGSDGGIVIGKIQPGSSDWGCSFVGISGLIDAPWCFFGNTGVHQTIAVPVTDNGDGTLDFTGWGVTWNGIPNIPLGGAPEFGETGRANISCSSPACAYGDSYVIDYTAHVRSGDPSGFGGVYYGVHLEGFIGAVPPVANVEINVSGGLTQECTVSGGANVTMDTSIIVPDDDSVASINWMIDGNPAGSGSMITEFLSLGTHQVEVTLTTTNGLSDTASTNVVIEDTTAPVVSADFINSFTGMSVTDLQRFNFLRIQAAASDVCDPNPQVDAMIGAPVNDGDAVFIMKYFGNVSINLTKIDLTVRATDSQNNVSSQTATINIGN